MLFSRQCRLTYGFWDTDETAITYLTTKTFSFTPESRQEKKDCGLNELIDIQKKKQSNSKA